MTPKKEKTIQEKLNSIKESNEDFLEKANMFLEVLNHSNPSQKDIEEVPIGNGQKAKYIPIEKIEMMLDNIFLEWSTCNESTLQVFNELCVSLELHVLNPATGNMIKRVGTGSATIQQNKVYDPDAKGRDKNGYRSARLDEFNHTKVINASQAAYPAAKSIAISNAAKSLGTIFGRNLNRKHERPYSPVYQNAGDTIEKERTLNFIQETSDKKQLESISEEKIEKYPEVKEELDKKLSELDGESKKQTRIE